jgi:hypothetical protein
MRYTIYLKAEDKIQRIVVVADGDATPKKAEFSAEFVQLGDAIFRVDALLAIVPASAKPK